MVRSYIGRASSSVRQRTDDLGRLCHGHMRGAAACVRQRTDRSVAPVHAASESQSDLHQSRHFPVLAVSPRCGETSQRFELRLLIRLSS